MPMSSSNQVAAPSGALSGGAIAGCVRSKPDPIASRRRGDNPFFVFWILAMGCVSVGLWRDASAQGFWPKTDFATGGSPASVAVGDVNGDGKPDLVVAIQASGGVSVLLGNGAGGFGARTDFVGGANPQSVAIGDVSGDGKPDLAMANVSSNTVAVKLGDGTGGFGGSTHFATGTQPYSVAIGDVNGDGATEPAPVLEQAKRNKR